MPKADDSSLEHGALQIVEARARDLLNRAEAWDRLPTPIDDILEAAHVKVASSNAFDLQHIMAYLADKAAEAGAQLKSALGKLFGVYDASDQIIHIDEGVAAAKQTFLKLHEVGHHEMPTHRKLFAGFLDCDKNLEPEIADLFEREANNFARFSLFQGDRYAKQAADMPLAIKSAMRLADEFGASIYASAREFARTNHRECLVYVLEPVEYARGPGFRAAVRRAEPSPSFLQHFGKVKATAITPDHRLGKVVPLGNRRVTKPMRVIIRDLNGDDVEAVAEAFNTTHNIIILLYTERTLKAAGLASHALNSST